MKAIRDIFKESALRGLTELMDPFSGKQLLISLSPDGGYEGELQHIDMEKEKSSEPSILL